MKCTCENNQFNVTYGMKRKIIIAVSSVLVRICSGVVFSGIVSTEFLFTVEHHCTSKLDTWL